MMLDADVVAVSASSVYRVLKAAGVLDRHNRKPSQKGKGFNQPQRPAPSLAHRHRYLNIGGTFYYMCSVLDGYSRYIVHWEIRETMTEQDVETILQRAREKFPGETPRIISDNGPQFIAKDFKEFIRICGMTHVRTSPYYPQSNGKLERYHRTIKGECIRPGTPLSLEDARRLVPVTSSITTKSACTVRWATSRRPTSCTVARRRSSPRATQSFKRHVSVSGQRQSRSRAQGRHEMLY